AAPGVEVPIEAVVGEVQPAVGKPARPRRAARRVEHAAEWTREADAEILDDAAPVPLRVVHRAALQLFQRSDAQPPHEPGDLRALDILGRGAPPVFSAGADAALKSSMSAEERRQAMAARKSQFRRLFERVNTTLEGLEQITIAAVNGHAVGGGWGLTLACDFRLAAAEAQFWIPEVDLGVPLGVASTTRFVRLVGPARAKEIILECRRYGAEEARAMGLVHRVVPD